MAIEMSMSAERLAEYEELVRHVDRVHPLTRAELVALVKDARAAHTLSGASAGAQRLALVQWLGAAFGMAGAMLLAMQIHPAWGFGAFLISNCAWLAFASRHRLRGLLLQQVVFGVTSLVGLWNWWLGPILIGGAA